MMTFVICTAFGAFLCWQFSKAYFLAKNKLKEMKEDGYQLTCVNASKPMLTLYSIIIVAAMTLFVYSIVNMDSFEAWETGISTGALITLMAVGKLMSSSVFHKFYYDHEIILYIDKVYRWKGIKNIEGAKRSFFKSTMNLFNGKSVTIPKKIGFYIETMLPEKKKNK